MDTFEVHRVNDAYSAGLLYCSDNGTGSSDEEVAIVDERSCRILVKENKIIKRRVLHRVRYFVCSFRAAFVAIHCLASNDRFRYCRLGRLWPPSITLRYKPVMVQVFE